MTAIRKRVVLTLALALAFVAASLAFTARTSEAGAQAPVTYIVEFQKEPAAVHAARQRQAGRALTDAELQSYRDGLRAEQDNFLASLASRGVAGSVASREVKNFDGATAATLQLRYTYVYNGLALKAPRGAAAAIGAMPGVKAVHADDLLYTQLNHSVDYINAPKVYGKAAELTQFDNLREGFEGQGINIAIIDTGIDWTHPMFGGDPTPPRLAVAPPAAAAQTNQKVIYYLPLTDIAVQDGFGHGTHVASTAAGYLARHPGGDGLPGTADDLDMHGVAPQAKLMSYKVCSDIQSTVSQVVPIGGCASSDTIMALEDALSPFTVTMQPKPVAHVINLSLGGSGGPDNPTAVACSNAALAGATVVASSGNSGPGEGTTGAPAAGRHVISVGANTHPGAAGSTWSADLLQASAIPAGTVGAVSPAKTLAAASGFSRIKLFPMSGTASLPAASMAQRYAFVNLPLGGTWPAEVRGRIALVRDALGATIFDVVAQAYNAGAVGVILFDDRGTVNGVKTLIPAATVAPADGELLVDALSSTDDNSVDPQNGAVSELPVRMNPSFSDDFVGEMGGFSSRGPVRGLGQIKPDVTAPGVAVLAAVPPASLLGAIGTLEGTPNYAHLDGTSMSSPHTAGAAALVKQAHLDWTPDMIRTALINTATNLRDQSGAAKPDGPSAADSIIAQGGGLIDVPEALNAKALMGVEGDGIEAPAILGSHSYGEVPVVNSRTTHTSPVTVTVRDLSGQGGTYTLGVANNRDLQLAGIGVSLSEQSVTVPANGEATFTVNATVDGDLLRDVMAAKTVGTSVVFERIQMQWFVTARRADGGEHLRMPFFFRPGASLPEEPEVVTTSHTDTVIAGDAGTQVVGGVTYVDVPFEVDASTYHVEATTEWFELPAGDQPDLDYQLLDPAGNVVGSSGAAGGPEFVSVRVTQPGTYTHRVVGFTNAATEFTVKTTLSKGAAPPALEAIAGDFSDAQGREVDFDGAFSLAWGRRGDERGFEVERSADGGQNWQTIASVAGSAAGIALTDQPDGALQYRVRALTPGQIGNYVTPGGAAQSVVVDRRTQADITALVQTAMSNVSFAGGVFQLDLNINNTSANAYLPRVELRVVRVNSASGTVRAANADNNGAGTPDSPALFDYSNQLGADQVFSGGETTAARTLRFSDPKAELFTFDVQVTAFQHAAGAGASSNSASGAGGGGGGGEPTQSSLNKLAAPSVMRFTANPLTKTVNARLVSLR